MAALLVKLAAGSGLVLSVLAAAPLVKNPFELAQQAARTGPAGQLNYLAPQLDLQRARHTYLADPNQAGMYWQAAATYASFAGELDSVTAYLQRLGWAAPGPVPATWPPAPPLPAAGPAILAETQSRQLVLFNEEHTQPRGRWLVGSLLPALWRQGFRVLALEALEAADTAGVRRRGFAVGASGFYLNEPHFGNLVRRARQLGFRVVAYDDFGADREQGEARNLLAVTGLPASGARVVVLAGHGHIDEAPDGTSMARWLQRLSGLDPLTIEQTQAVGAGRPAWQLPPAGAYVVPAASLPNRKLRCDLYVLNCLDVRTAGNAWGAALPPTTIQVPADSLRPGEAAALQVYQQAEYPRQPGAVPVAVRCLWPGQSACKLSLAPGTYTVLLRDAQGRRRWQRPLAVGAGLVPARR